MKTIAINLFALTTLAAGCIALPVSTARGSTATLNELAWAFEYDPGGQGRQGKQVDGDGFHENTLVSWSWFQCRAGLVGNNGVAHFSR